MCRPTVYHFVIFEKELQLLIQQWGSEYSKRLKIDHISCDSFVSNGKVACIQSDHRYYASA